MPLHGLSEAPTSNLGWRLHRSRLARRLIAITRGERYVIHKKLDPLKGSMKSIATIMAQCGSPTDRDVAAWVPFLKNRLYSEHL